MPNHRHTNHSQPVNHALSKLSRFLTPNRFRKGERKVSKEIDFKDVHRSIAQRQFEYLDAPRSNYVRARGTWFQELAPEYAYGLGAANIEARINFMEIALRRLRRHAELYQAPIFLVTVCPRRYVCPIEQAAQTDLIGLRQTTRQALAGCSFIGMIEFALLKSWGRDGISAFNDHVGPHTHNLVFGSTRKRIESAIAAMGNEFRDITHRRAANVLEITSRQLDGYFRYILKAPLSEYHVRAGSRCWHNAETDERVQLPKLDPHPLRPGDQLRMSAVLSDMYLDELLFGQGECTALVREIIREARKPIRQFNLRAARWDYTPRAFVSLVRSMPSKDRRLLSKLVLRPPPRIKQRFYLLATALKRPKHRAARRDIGEEADA